MRVVIDIDDTISFHTNRDYDNAIPNERVINKIREIRNTVPEAKITLYTARGMASCNGDVIRADMKNRETLEKWLLKHDVPYDELLFGKPLADLYIDDRGISADDFARSQIEEFSGFSGDRVYRIDKYVFKESERAKEQYEWYLKSQHIVSPLFITPKMYSCVLNHLCMSYVQGEQLSTRVNIGTVKKMLGIAKQFSMAIYGVKNNVDNYAEYIRRRQKDVGIESDTPERILSCKQTLETKTFCHGDFTFTNAIVTPDFDICLIDPVQRADLSHWLLDVSKLRGSICWLDYVLTGISHSRNYADVIDSFLTQQELDAVIALEKSHLIRVLYYAVKNNRVREESLLREAFYGI